MRDVAGLVEDTLFTKKKILLLPEKKLKPAVGAALDVAFILLSNDGELVTSTLQEP